MLASNALEPDNIAFIKWAKENAITLDSLDVSPKSSNDKDLIAISNAIGDAKIVGLSEGYHNCREMMSLHHRIIQHLVTNHGFNTVVTETGLPESRIINEYVAGSDFENTEWMWKNGLNKMYSEWNEGRDLIEWMRQYNLSHNNALQYYGVDIGGFYENWKIPFQRMFGYLETVDSDYEKELSVEFYPFLDLMEEKARLAYNSLSPEEKDKLKRILDIAVDVSRSRRKVYVENSTECEYQWFLQSMISFQLAENYYRNYNDRCSAQPNKYVGLNGREIAMHNNILWVMRQQSNAKVIWINHVIHTKTETQYQDKIWGYYTPTGQMLRETFGKYLCVIGMVYGSGKYWKNWQQPTDRVIASIPSADSNGIEQVLAAVGRDMFFINWKASDTKLWLHKTLSMRENDYFIKIKPIEWDACIFIKNVTGATAHTTGSD